jgi:lanosterol synthase
MATDFNGKIVIEKGVKLLLSRQAVIGDWSQENISGVFNYNCMITYSNYRNVFPIWALSRYYRRYVQE